MSSQFKYCVGSSTFSPSDLINNTKVQGNARDHLTRHDVYHAIVALFNLSEKDDFIYHATASVKLAQVQHVVSLGRANNLHAWYRNEDGITRDPPPQSDIEAYISIFSPFTATASAMKNFATNARKGSLRAEAAALLLEKKHVHPTSSAKLTIPKSKKPPSNPYFDFWAWSCRSLEWCGPCRSSEQVGTSHHVLPIFMHHFGCVTPSHESLEVIKMMADGRAIADMGSGNGYWAFMLRNYGLTVHPVDNMQSEWRVKWIDDTIISDGVNWLKKKQNGRDMVLLMVYPVVGGGPGGGNEGAFTKTLMDTFQGDTVAVVGTQNGNGYTGFRGVTMDQYMEREHQDWTKVVQIPLPSFAGKDEALYIFQRGNRAPPQGNS